MKCDRRQVLGRAGAALGLGLIDPTRLLAAPGARPTLVTVYLRGGWDALNVVIPYRDPLYYEHRPTIAIPAADQGEARGVIALDRQFGLHPALRPLAPYYEQRKLAPITCVGSPHPTRSHFDAQDFMEYASPGERTLRGGWLNRYLAMTSRPGDERRLRAISLQRLLPRALRGEYPVLAVPPGGGPGEPEHAFEDLYEASPGQMDGSQDGAPDAAPDDHREGVVHTGQSTIQQLRRYEELIAKGTDAQADEAYPKGGFAQGLRTIARLIRAGAGLEVAALDIQGWDHHANEAVAAEGVLARMLGDLSSGLAAFLADVATTDAPVLVLVMSEFGRTVRENGTAGTDHGRGGHMLVMGTPMLVGGRIYGGWLGLGDNVLADRRDLPVVVDFREVFLEVLNGLFSWDAVDLMKRQFFPGTWRPNAAQSRAVRFVERPEKKR
jgi:uncharacterized protein (DUF1501 family)